MTTPNLDDARAFLDVFFAPGDVIELRLIGDGPPRQVWRDYERRHELAPIAAAANAAGRHVYLGVNPRPAIGASGNKCIVLARSVFVDLDAKHLAATDEAGQLAEIARRVSDACIVPPSLIVFSGHGWHLYWFFDAPLADMNRWAALIDNLIAALDSDTACRNAERVMRSPGFINPKPPEAFARIVYCDPSARYSVADLESPFYHGNMGGDLPDDPRAAGVDVAKSLAAHGRRPATYGHDARVIDAANDRWDVREIERDAGYTIVGDRFRRPGKADRGFSGIFRRNGQRREVSCHWSENDPLNDRKFGGRAGRPGQMGIHDAFSAFAMLHHGGDVSAAVKAAARLLGIALPPHKRDGDILRLIQASADADAFARLFFGDTADTNGGRRVLMAEIIRKHTTNPKQLDRILAAATPTKAKEAA